MNKAFKVFLAFIKKDLREELSYKFEFILKYTGMFVHILIFWGISKFLGVSLDSEKMKMLTGGNDYFSYVIIGIAFIGLLHTGLNSFSSSISDAQTKGTLEAIILTPTNTSLIIIASSLWRFTYMTLRIFLYIFMGLILGAKLNIARLPSAFIFLVLTVLAYSSIGIISASVIMVLKKGNPINAIFGGAGSMLLGGVYFPPELLPSFLSWFAKLLPIYHAMSGIRGALLMNKSILDMKESAFFMMGFICIFLPLGVYCFAYAVSKAKEHGSLTHY
ncbi:ABC transporter permease [bacterium]|nr:ABC transporter permease [bacterium]